MQRRIKQCVGIDCAKDELVVSYGVMDENFDIKFLSTTSFKNGPGGFKKLTDWSKRLNPDDGERVYLMEATGVYHEKVALFLQERNYKVVVILPNRANAFMKTLSVKTVNDDTSSRMLAQMGLEKKLDLWQPPAANYNNLRQLTRERDQVMVEQTQIKNQIHAEESGAWPNQQSIKRMNSRLKLIKKQINEVEKDIADAIKAEPFLEKKIKKICSIKGVGVLTAVTVIAETNGFNLIRNKNQLVSYAGLDVITKDSGTSVRSKPRISRHGNKYLRKCLYLPALAALRSDGPMKAHFIRLVSKHGIKMKAAVAIQRKLLILIYTLWKKDEVYDEKYYSNKKEPQNAEALYELA